MRRSISTCIFLMISISELQASLDTSNVDLPQQSAPPPVESDLSFTHLGPHGVPHLLSRLEVLTVQERPHTLLLQECSLGDTGASLLLSSSHIRGIRDLSLKHNHITSKGARTIFQHLRKAATSTDTDKAYFLTSLALDHNPLGDSGLQPLPALLEVTGGASTDGEISTAVSASLESLSLQFCGIGPVGCRSLASALIKNASGPTPLQSLSLAGNPIGDVGARAIAAALRAGAGLTELDLTRCGIGEDGARCLAEALKKNTSLKWLGLNCNEVGEGGAGAFANLLRSRACSLSRLDIGSNNIGDAGAALLANGLSVGKKGKQSSTPLLSLDLSCNGIGSEGAATLAAALSRDPPLMCLDLSGNRLCAGPPKDGKGSITKKAGTAVLSSLNRLYTHLTDDGMTSLAASVVSRPSAELLSRALRRNTHMRWLGVEAAGGEPENMKRLINLAATIARRVVEETESEINNENESTCIKDEELDTQVNTQPPHNEKENTIQDKVEMELLEDDVEVEDSSSSSGDSPADDISSSDEDKILQDDVDKDTPSLNVDVVSSEDEWEEDLGTKNEENADGGGDSSSEEQIDSEPEESSETVDSEEAQESQSEEDVEVEVEEVADFDDVSAASDEYDLPFADGSDEAAEE